MTSDFDPYLKWLEIPADQRPPNHYQLLGLQESEADPVVIREAVEQRAAQVRKYHLGKYSDISQQILNELAAASFCLCDPQQRAAYNAQLAQTRQELAQTAAPSPSSPSPSSPSPVSRNPVSGSLLSGSSLSGSSLSGDQTRGEAPLATFSPQTAGPEGVQLALDLPAEYSAQDLQTAEAVPTDRPGVPARAAARSPVRPAAIRSVPTSPAISRRPPPVSVSLGGPSGRPRGLFGLQEQAGAWWEKKKWPLTGAIGLGVLCLMIAWAATLLLSRSTEAEAESLAEARSDEQSDGHAPLLAAVPRRVSIGQKLEVSLQTLNQDSLPGSVRYYLALDSPPGVRVDEESGKLTWAVPNNWPLGPCSLQVRAETGEDDLLRVCRIPVVVLPPLKPPRVKPVPRQTVTLGEEIRLQLDAQDPNVPPVGLEYHLGTGPPAGVWLNKKTGEFVWRPHRAGRYVIPIIVGLSGMSEGAPSGRVSLEFFVQSGQAAGYSILPSAQRGTVGQVLAFQVKATNPSNPSFQPTFSLGADPPAGTSIDPETGVVMWQPERAGSFSIPFRVGPRGAYNPDLWQSASVTVIVAPPLQTPMVAPFSVPRGMVGNPIVLTIPARDPNNPPQGLTFRLVGPYSGDAKLDSKSGQFRWIPRAPGEYRFTASIGLVGHDAPTRQVPFKLIVANRPGWPNLAWARYEFRFVNTRDCSENTLELLLRPDGNIELIQGSQLTPLTDASWKVVGTGVMLLINQVNCRGRISSSGRLSGSARDPNGQTWTWTASALPNP